MQIHFQRTPRQGKPSWKTTLNRTQVKELEPLDLHPSHRRLLAALAVRPLSRILRFNRLLDVRRMIGVGAFAYAAGHFPLYTFELDFDWREIASEIVHRNRLTLGFVALLGLTALTATSTDGMVRRLGSKHWQRLHKAIYLIGVLVLIHYFLRFKLIESTPTFATGLFGLLFRFRMLVWWRTTRSGLPTWMFI